MKPIVYIETSVISYLVSRPSRDIVIAGRQAVTQDWWDRQSHQFELRVSALVEEEASRGDAAAVSKRLATIDNIPRLAISDLAIDVAQALLDRKAVPVGSEDDALHIAVAATQGVEFLLTWNFKHINNAETKGFIADVIDSYDLLCPVLCSPEELGGNTK